jgi:hypothetical protein
MATKKTMTKEERAAGVRARRKQRRKTARAVKAANVWQPPKLSEKAQEKRARRKAWARRLADVEKVREQAAQG